MSQLLDQISEKQNIQNCLEELVNEIQERTTHGSKPDYLKHSSLDLTTSTSSTTSTAFCTTTFLTGVHKIVIQPNLVAVLRLQFTTRIAENFVVNITSIKANKSHS